MITEGFLIQYRHMSKTPRRVICLLGASVKVIEHTVTSGVLRRKRKLPGFVMRMGKYPLYRNGHPRVMVTLF